MGRGRGQKGEEWGGEVGWKERRTDGKRRGRTEKGTDREGHGPRRARTEKGTDREGHGPRRQRSGKGTDREGHGPRRPWTEKGKDRKDRDRSSAGRDKGGRTRGRPLPTSRRADHARTNGIRRSPDLLWNFLIKTSTERTRRSCSGSLGGFTVSNGGMSSYVRPSSSRPAFFFWNPPHCLKKKGTRWSTH